MQILVSEYLCGGSWPEPDWPASLLAEGRGMLEAVMLDLSALADVSVVTTWDRRLQVPAWLPVEGVHLEPADSPQQADSILTALARSADAALVIAPEFDQLLERRCQFLTELGVPLLNCSPSALRTCADKLTAFQICSQQGIQTVPTHPVEEVPRWLPGVVKRRDGAGSLGMQLISTREDWNRWHARTAIEQYIQQPFVQGIACSMAAICNRGEVQGFLPLADQHLSTDGQFQYLGGTIPAGGMKPEPFQAAISAFSRAVPGLHGYVGFDFLVSEEAGQPLLVDVNPRLCTSYLGYRVLCREGLGACLVRPGSAPLPHFTKSITFRVDTTQVRP